LVSAWDLTGREIEFGHVKNKTPIFQTILTNIRGDLFTRVGDRGRKFWGRSPLNLATYKMRADVVAMMVREAGVDVNSVDEVRDCQR
jgi:hypothetical protein